MVASMAPLVRLPPDKSISDNGRPCSKGASDTCNIAVEGSIPSVSTSGFRDRFLDGGICQLDIQRAWA